MRRGGTVAGIIAIVLLGIVVTGFVAYGRGETAGQTAASSDRSGFTQSRGLSGTSGFGGKGASGSASAGGGGRSVATGQASGGAATALAGKVTKVDNGTLTLQQAGTTTATIATDAATTVTTFAPGALSDLATGDVVALQGEKTSDTAFTATTIYALNRAQNGGQAGRTPGGANTTAGTGAAGTPTGGGRNRGAGGASGSAPAGGNASANLFPGLNGPTGRITTIDAGTLTLQGFDGTTTTVTTNASTVIRTETPGTVGDIKAGDTVSVQGATTGGATTPARAIIDLGTVA